LRQLKLIVFDWDGTLMDSEYAIVDAIRKSYEEEGLAVPAYGAIRETIGLSLRDAWKCLSPDIKAAVQGRLTLAYSKYFLGRPTLPPLFPKVRETLIELRESGYLMAVATGKSQAGLKRAIEGTAIGEFFTTTRTADVSEPKPSPKMLQEIMSELSLAPREVIMIGDTEYDLAMAAAAGTLRAGVNWGVHSVNRLLPFAPSFVLSNFNELPIELKAME